MFDTMGSVHVYCSAYIDLSWLSQLGLNPDVTLHHPGSRAAAIGIRCGSALAEIAQTDVLNLLGTISGQIYNLVPYSDYTNYTPANTAYNLVDKTRWQPLIIPVKNSLGQFCEQVRRVSIFFSKNISLLVIKFKVVYS